MYFQKCLTVNQQDIKLQLASLCHKGELILCTAIKHFQLVPLA